MFRRKTGLALSSHTDFLPFTCNGCSGVFCLEHRTHAGHDCPNANFNDVSDTSYRELYDRHGKIKFERRHLDYL